MVGDFDAGQVAALVKELFTGFASRAPFARVEREYRDVKPARIVLDTPDKENAIIRARLDFPLRDDDPDAPALTLANDIFGGNFLSRINMNLRETKGWSYGVRSLLPQPIDRASFQIFAPVQADRTGDSIAELRKVGAAL